MQEATAEALAPEEVQTEATPEEDLGAIYDALTKDDETPEAEAPEAVEPEQPVEESQEPEETVKVSEAPSYLPREVRNAWANIDPEAQEALSTSYQELNRKLSENGRMVQGLKPVQDSLVRAVKELPHLADMKPAQVADQIFELAKVSAQFSENPVQALMGYIEKHGLKEQMAGALQGQPVQGGETIQRLNNHIAQLERKISQFENPEYLQSQFQQFHTVNTLEDSVTKFAGSAEHWADVEEHLPAFIATEQNLRPDGSPEDILKAAYEAAVSRLVPEAKKAPEAAQAAQTDPEKTKAALKAKSVNVRSQPSNKSRTLSEEEELAAVWDKNQT